MLWIKERTYIIYVTLLLVFVVNRSCHTSDCQLESQDSISTDLCIFSGIYIYIYFFCQHNMYSKLTIIGAARRSQVLSGSGIDSFFFSESESKHQFRSTVQVLLRPGSWSCIWGIGLEPRLSEVTIWIETIIAIIYDILIGEKSDALRGVVEKKSKIKSKSSLEKKDKLLWWVWSNIDSEGISSGEWNILQIEIVRERFSSRTENLGSRDSCKSERTFLPSESLIWENIIRLQN